MVERTAHNGLVVGSNPTKLKKNKKFNFIFKLEIIQKNYKIITIKNIFKTENIFFILNSLNQNSFEKTFTEQKIQTLNLNFKKISNKLIRVVLKQSVHWNLKVLFSGITCLIKLNLNKINLNKKIIYNKFAILNFGLSSFKLNTKVYCINNLKKIYFFNYFCNALFFLQYLILSLKINVFLNKKNFKQ